MADHENFVKARKTSNIDQQSIIDQIWNGKQNHKNFVDFMKKQSDNNLFRPKSFNEQSRNDKFIYGAKNTRKFLTTMDIDFGIKKVPNGYVGDTSSQVGGIGLVMGLPIIDLSGSEEQKKEWIPRIQSGEILCCYGQTELGHGSDVQSLETTAVYNESDETFTINTPSISAYKWWPGDLGKASNYAVIYARVYSQGKYRGMYPLFFQVRDIATHKLFPGVESGDIGPKLGYSTKDNGYMAFNKVKVPRTALLSKYVEVYKDGTFQIKGDLRVFYSAMMVIRESILTSMPKHMAIIVLTTLRYSHIRSQFKPEKSNPERSIIDYQLQKSKIYPCLALSYVFQLSTHKISEFINKHHELVSKNQDYSLMKEVHIFLSMGKALYTGYTLDCLVAMMQACGGHGFLESAGISKKVDGILPATIVEGVNTILLVQVGKELEKSYKAVKSSNHTKLLEQMSYFKDMENIFNFQAESSRCRDIITYVNIFAKTTVSQVHKANLIEKDLSSKMSKNDIHDMKIGNLMVEAAVSHAIYITLKFFNEKVSNLSNSPLKKALSKLGLLAAIFFTNQITSTIFSCNAVDDYFFDNITQLYEDLQDEIHPDALVLAEGFGFPEFYIEHYYTLAHSDGKIYENLLNYAQKYGNLNKFDVHPTMLEYIAAIKEGRDINPRL